MSEQFPIKPTGDPLEKFKNIADPDERQGYAAGAMPEIDMTPNQGRNEARNPLEESVIAPAIPVESLAMASEDNRNHFERKQAAEARRHAEVEAAARRVVDEAALKAIVMKRLGMRAFEAGSEDETVPLEDETVPPTSEPRPGGAQEADVVVRSAANLDLAEEIKRIKTAEVVRKAKEAEFQATQERLRESA